MISPFDVTDADEVIWSLPNPGVLLRSHPSKIVARWKRYVRPYLSAYTFLTISRKIPLNCAARSSCF
jgi:hypothetical protein